MTTLADAISALKTQHPTLKIGGDEVGYTDLSSADYDATITQWAQAQLDAEQRVADNLAADKAISDARTSGITHALSLGFTQAQAEAMFP